MTKSFFLYRSNILGEDLRITNYGGGNTSCKTIEKDQSNLDVEVMWIKDLVETLVPSNVTELQACTIRGYMILKSLPWIRVRNGCLFNHCIYDLNSRAPSIDTPLHGLLHSNILIHIQTH